MTKAIQFDPKRLYFIPLGGSGEIGMNLNVYAYGGKLLVVDVGVTFEDLPGIEVVMAKVDWLKKQAKHIVGIVVTHAHEDHVGAIGHLWRQLKAPIYMTPFTAEIAEHKLREAKVDAPLRRVPLDGEVELKPFRVGFVSLTHSIPEPSALAIQTDAGIVVHTGDWKFDKNPLIGQPTNQEALEALGHAGVLGLVCDSTCVFEPGWSGSEKTVEDALIKEVTARKKGRVVVACFASNVARLVACFKAADKSKRRIILAGRSLERMEEAARKTGYLDDSLQPLTPKEGASIAPKDALIVATGSQGEGRAALKRMAEGTHPFLKLEAGDTVIFSSRIIPGNEKEIFALQNQLILRGVTIITPKDHPEIHVSGHPSRDELKQMYDWIKPKNAVPVHGEDRHLVEHARMAKIWGAQSIAPRNGDVILFDEHDGPSRVGRVHTGRLGLDGKRLIPLEGTILTEREKLASGGLVSVAILLDEGSRVEAIDITLFGLHESHGKDAFVDDLSAVVRRFVDHLPSQQKEDESRLRQSLMKEISSHCYGTLGKRPVIMVHVF